MKFHRIATLPFALLVDACTLGNLGGRSFTQQVFDAEERDRAREDLKAVVEAAKVILESGEKK